MNLKHIGESLHVSESHLPGSLFDRVTMSGTTFRKARIDKAVVEEADLSGLSVTRCDLRGAAISQCHLDGMRIDGIAVTDLLAAYRGATASLPPE